MSPTEKLVEKVAEAIHKCAADNVGTETPEWTTECPEVKAQVRLLAKAALSAIPYPSEEEIAELRKDAERYRWLRDDNAYAPEEKMIQGGEELDDFIDAQLEECLKRMKGE